MSLRQLRIASWLYLALICLSGCSVVDGSADATVFTWNDLDGDGVVDQKEPPLPWVTVSTGYPDFLTGDDGRVHAWTFKPGCAHDCWRGEAVSARTPPGYRVTTLSRQPLIGHNRLYTFGYQIEDSSQIASFPGEPDWYQAFSNRGARLLDFHYSSDRRLSIELDTESVPVDDYYPDEYIENFYFDTLVFDIILSLSRMHGISIDQIEMRLAPAGELVLCDFSTVRQWEGKISGAEIVSDYCEHVHNSE